MGQVRQPTYTYRKPQTGERELRTSAVWWIRYFRNGRRFDECSHTTKKTKAIELLRQREGAIANGEPVTPEIGKLTFDDAVKDVVNDYRVNGKRTLADVERRITLHLEPFFGGRRMSTITTPDIRAFIAHRQAPVQDPVTGVERRRPTNAEINRELAIIRRAFRLALHAGKLLHVPHVPMLRENNVRQGFFEREQFEAVRRFLPEHLRGAVTFAYLTGWRILSEVLPYVGAGRSHRADRATRARHHEECRRPVATVCVTTGTLHCDC